jgi:ribonucleoside-diphosphate reductase alpha chain
MSAIPKEAGFDNYTTFRQIRQVRKRDGSLVDYDFHKVENAIAKAMYSAAEAEDPDNDSTFVARNVESQFRRMATALGTDPVPAVEAIQDAIERELMLQGYTRTAKAFILYREERARIRAKETEIPQHVKQLAQQSKRYFPNSLSEFVYYRTYSRWIDSEGRRETWIETVQRYMDFMQLKLGAALTNDEYSVIHGAILDMQVMPSMRLMWSAGKAAEKTNVAAFNCAFIAPTLLQDFGEILYILACGTGVGFAVESRNVQQLPVIEFQKASQAREYTIDDSKEGWADALTHGLLTWYAGDDVDFDYSFLRPEGARLKTMGGRSSGPKPLMELLQFTRRLVLSRQGRRLSNIDVHDLICKIGDCIVAGGVRRSALISLSDLDDVAMQRAKEGHFWLSEPQRQLANNSAVYTSKPSDLTLMREWLALVESRSGERGIFNRGDLLAQVPARRHKLWIDMGLVDGTSLRAQVGTNPCGEIYLLSKQFCNLTEVVCRSTDTKESLLRKIRIATILGTYQATLTDYPYLSKEWKENCEREALLGVSLTGQWDCADAMRSEVLLQLRDHAVEVNKEYAKRFGIAPSSAVTCGKPSGTVSQLVDASSGGHARFAPYYIRRVRISSTDPLFRMLKDQGLRFFPEVGQTYDSATTFVFEFPVKAPEGSVFHPSALEQLDHWMRLKRAYTEHNPSVTISVRPDEWVLVLSWLRENWRYVGGLSFLPADDHVYQLAPYEAITKEKYEEMLKTFEGIDYSRIVTYEKEDETQGSKELACVSGVCEI